jgi:CRISPR-associated endonuclease/helicase Cas3
MHFGLLNNDALWVLDETQLMGVGVRTSAQLEGLRKRIGVAAPVVTWWASATLDKRLLKTVDHPEIEPSLELNAVDRKDKEVLKRVGAVKRVSKLAVRLAEDSSKTVDPYVQSLAGEVCQKHQASTLTLVILNRVDRARKLFMAIEKNSKGKALPEQVLIHSRFRPIEREELAEKLNNIGEKIIVATQAVEAGVDISARTLITELAPWSSLVQRFGRCNRSGEFNKSGGADVFWIDLDTKDEKAAKGVALPYLPEQMNSARDLLKAAEDSGASPSALESLKVEEPLAESHILRKKDLIELFDTTPDLAGLDIDVGRYIRDGEERDVQVFWRQIGEGEPDEEIRPMRRELVRVGLFEFEKFRKKNKGEVWVWNVLDGGWERAQRLAPGQTYLIDYDLGGYSATLGWTGEKEKGDFPILTLADQEPQVTERDGQNLDDASINKPDFQSIEEHTADVVKVCKEIIASLPAAELWKDSLVKAARWHDVGKAHACFQAFITKGRNIPELWRDKYIAKAPWKSGVRHERPHFRHELASALAWLQVGVCEDEKKKNLIAFLIATHHGKIRLSIRSMPGEKIPPNPESLFARGVWQGDVLPGMSDKVLAVADVELHSVSLDLSYTRMGESNGSPSWNARCLSLRDGVEFGSFRLGWLECLVRAADARGSRGKGE